MASDAELVSLPSSEHSAVSLPSDGSSMAEDFAGSSFDEGPGSGGCVGDGLWDPLHVFDCGIRCGCSEKCHLKFQSDSQTMHSRRRLERQVHMVKTQLHLNLQFILLLQTLLPPSIHNNFSDSPGMGPFLFQLVRAVIMMTPPSARQRQKIAWQLLGSHVCRKAFYTALKIGEARLDR